MNFGWIFAPIWKPYYETPNAAPTLRLMHVIRVAPYLEMAWESSKRGSHLSDIDINSVTFRYMVSLQILHDLLHSAWPIPLAPAQTMSGGWGEGRADCAQANSFRLKLLRHVMTRYDTLWDVETLSLNISTHFNTFQPKVSVVPVSTRCQSPLNGELCAESDEAQATACRGWKWHARGRCVLVLEISGENMSKTGWKLVSKLASMIYNSNIFELLPGDFQKLLNKYTPCAHLRAWSVTVYSVWGCHEWTIQMAQTSRPCVSRVSWNQV